MYILNFSQKLNVLKISEETIYWKTSSSSSFFLSAEKTIVKTEEELLAFDFEDLVNGLGGALGLFLGWSLLHIFYQCFQFLHQSREWLKNTFIVPDKEANASTY